jgi:hypothetical protein
MFESYATNRPVSQENDIIEIKLKNRVTEQSRQFGFLRFASIEEAEDFMNRHYPIIYLYGDSEKSSGANDEFRVRLSYGKERRDNRIDDNDWICPSVGADFYHKLATNSYSAISTTTLLAQDAFVVRRQSQVSLSTPIDRRI